MSERNLEGEGEGQSRVSQPNNPQKTKRKKKKKKKETKRKKKTSSQESDETLETLKQLGQTKLAKNIDDDIHCINIVGQIEGHKNLPAKNKTTKYEHLIPQLVAVQQNPKVKGVIITLNTVGGDIEAGLAISEMISGISKPTVSLVLGGGHSIGVPIAVATDKSFIAETATMTIHPIRLTGKVIGVPQTYDYLDKMQDRVIDFVNRHSDINDQDFRDLMFETGELVRDVGTVLIGEEAVKEGVIGEVGGISQALKSLRAKIDAEKDSNNKVNTQDNNEDIATEAIEVVRENILM